MVKCINLCSRTAKICRLHSPATSVTNIISHHNVTAVGKPTVNTPETYSLVDTTEKVVEEQIMDESLLASQGNIDSRPASVIHEMQTHLWETR